MVIGVPRETRPDERRVAVTPETVHKLVGRGHTVLVETGAGQGSFLPDAQFETAGASVVSGDDLYARSELVLKVQRPRALADGTHEADRLREGAWLTCLLYPGEDADCVARLRARKVTVLAMEAVPRIARAQKMDALSSMANIAGYRAVLEAAQVFPRFFPLLMTAAGTVAPAQVLVIGVGVAGLSAIATARRLGGQVKAFDVRPAVQDQIRSLGAEPLALDMTGFDAEDKGGYAKAASDELLKREQALFEQVCPSVDIIITTALIAGKEAPRLLTDAAVLSMKPGSVIVDLAVEQGGNCGLSRVGEAVVTPNGATVLGWTNLASRMPADASKLYARNVLNLLLHMHGKAGWAPDAAEEITKAVMVLHPGQEG
jgi:NAD(P) transhydrogenase subunit alpha